MEKNKVSKSFKLAGAALEQVIAVSESTNRNYTGTLEYLIENGFQIFLKEQKLLSSLRNDNHVYH